MTIDVSAHITATVWKVQVAPGDRVSEGQILVILEAMKMEIPVEATDAGVVLEVCVAEGSSVDEGDVLVRLDAD